VVKEKTEKTVYRDRAKERMQGINPGPSFTYIAPFQYFNHFNLSTLSRPSAFYPFSSPAFCPYCLGCLAFLLRFRSSALLCFFPSFLLPFNTLPFRLSALRHPLAPFCSSFIPSISDLAFSP
jgi:hypothetical protein